MRIASIAAVGIALTVEVAGQVEGGRSPAPAARVPEKHIRYGEDVVEGRRDRPEVDLVSGRRARPHAPLIRIRQDFRDRVLASVGEL